MQATDTSASPAQVVRPSTRKHLGYVDGARAIAAVYVALHHSWNIVWSATPHPASAWLISGWLSYGHFAVSAFIAISGFSLMLPVVRGDGRLSGGALTFFKRRARRILPPYYFAMAFSLLLIWLLVGKPTGTAWDSSLPVTMRNFVAHVLLLQDFDRTGFYSINGVFWSIAIEWQIYFFFPLLVLLARRVTTLATALSVVALCYVVSDELLRFPTAGTGIPTFLPGRVMMIVDYLGLFALGMLAAAVAFSARPRWVAVRTKIPWGIVALGAIAALVALFAISGEFGLTPELSLDADYLTAFVTLALFISAARTERSVAGKVLGWKPVAFVGTFAYSIYLVHAPIIAAIYLHVVRPRLAVWFHFGYTLSLVSLMALAIPVVLVTAYLFFLACERPFLNKPVALAKAGPPASSTPHLAAGMAGAGPGPSVARQP